MPVIRDSACAGLTQASSTAPLCCHTGRNDPVTSPEASLTMQIISTAPFGYHTRCITCAELATSPEPSVAMQVISTARTCNLILIVLDCLKPISHKKLIEHELEGFGIRLNKEPPGITFRKKDKGGISLTTTISNPKLDLDGELMQGVYRRGLV